MPGALPIIAFISFALVLIPLPIHQKSRNVPLLSIIAWLAISNVTYGINSAIWNGNVRIEDLVWCDISTKLKIGSEIALPASAFALALQVYRITLQKNRLPFGHELLICFGVPILIMSLHTIVQGHRFDIYEDFGCTPAVYVSIPSIFILDIPPLVFSTLAFIFCSLAIMNFARQRMAFSRMVKDSRNPGLSKARYVRLMLITLILGVWNALVISLTRSSAYRNGLLPWVSWDDVHADFWSFEGSQYRLDDIPGDVLVWVYLGWFSVPVTSLFVFLLFSFGEEAAKDYRTWVSWVETTVFRRKSGSPSMFATKSSVGSIDKSDGVTEV
ncbi:Pheromone receptor [Mycena venus]|uniref:Pheromone receptor n=1 Tax=Mycena venus TaxID=2733690 RepID=A0A8H6YTK4_9AGAR|nr:Pheromone receptor [Mycena venus]